MYSNKPDKPKRPDHQITQNGKCQFSTTSLRTNAYETKIKDAWYPVARYDTSHGFAHRDLLDIKGGVKKTPLFNQDFNNALTFAENDLKLNWFYYKNRFLGEENE
jgi:hypothetical protein